MLEENHLLQVVSAVILVYMSHYPGNILVFKARTLHDDELDDC